MTTYEKSLIIMNELFSKDYQFALATASNNIPSVRVIDTYYENKAFYLVTYAKSQKAKEIEQNKNVSLCNHLYRFQGVATIIGHPLDTQNLGIRETLTKEFEPWYFAHNNESDPYMCYIRIDLSNGFIFKDGTGYQIDFINNSANEFPFQSDIIEIID